MISERVKEKINYMNCYRLEKLANWCWKRYSGVKEPEIARYIMVRHYRWEEYQTGLL
jgi:hypothetical protein